MTDIDNETRGFPPIEPIDAPPEMARFMTAMRRLQDIAVSTAPDGALWTDGAQRIEDLCERLEVHRAPQGVAPAGRPLTCPASVILWCRRGPSPTTDPTGSPCAGTSAASTSAATTPCTAG